MPIPNRPYKPGNLIIVLMLMLLISSSVYAGANKMQIGWVEDVYIPNFSFYMRAKMDTGADNSSINTIDQQIFNKGGQEWIRFSTSNRQGEDVVIESPIVKYIKIKGKNSQSQRRPVIRMSLCIGGVTKDVPVNLVNRQNFKYRMLIGRSFLAGDYLVDSSETLVIANQCHQDD